MPDLELTRDDGIATIELARPAKLNALSPALLEELIGACESLAGDGDVRVVVLQGAGQHFSAGADLPAFGEGLAAGDEALADLGRRATEALWRIPQISIASIHGHCVGGALVMAACCDLRVAAAGTRFSIPEVDAGIPLAWGGMGHLTRLIGETRATDLVLSCRSFGAEEALSAGFLTRVVEDAERVDAVADLARATARRPKKVLRLVKEQLVALRDGRYDPRRDAGALLAARSDAEAMAAGRAYIDSRIRKGR